MKDSNVQIFSFNYAEAFGKKVRLFVTIEGGAHNFYCKWESFEVKFMEVHGRKVSGAKKNRINTEVDIYNRNIDVIEDIMDSLKREIDAVIKTFILSVKKNGNKCIMYEFNYADYTYTIEDVKLSDIAKSTQG